MCNRSRVQRFRVQGSASPLAAEAASFIEEEISWKWHRISWSFIREVVGLHQIWTVYSFSLVCKKVLHRSPEWALSRQGGTEFQHVLDHIGPHLYPARRLWQGALQLDVSSGTCRLTSKVNERKVTPERWTLNLWTATRMFI